MKIALVHELLTMRGGAERVLKVLADMFPDAPIFTLLYDERKLGDWFPKERVRISTVQKYAWLGTNHHWYLPQFPRAVESWDFSEFNLVISSSSAFAHGIITNSAPRHLCYAHSPARYLWDRTHDVLERASGGPLGPFKRWYLSRVFHKLRIWDSEAADRPDVLLAASKEVQRRIELYWRRKSDVVYPPIDNFWFQQTENSRLKTEDYYLIVSTLSPYKRIDLAIEACNRRKTPLKIAGDGPDRRRLKRLAGPTVEFLGLQTEEQLKNLYANARATIFPGNEDFGLVPLESAATGTPVIAFRSGGALETILEGETGEFFDAQTPESLIAGMEKIEQKIYSKEACRSRARLFSRDTFELAIQTHIGNLCSRA